MIVQRYREYKFRTLQHSPRESHEVISGKGDTRSWRPTTCARAPNLSRNDVSGKVTTVGEGRGRGYRTIVGDGRGWPRDGCCYVGWGGLPRNRTRVRGRAQVCVAPLARPLAVRLLVCGATAAGGADRGAVGVI